jgi:hypothetical protein
MSDLNAKPSAASFWFSVLVITGCFLIFGFVLYVAYVPSRPKQVDPAANLSPAQRQELNQLSPDERIQRLADLRTKEAKGVAGYDWVDKEKGIVRLPLDRAIELTVQELQPKPQPPARTR